MWNRLKNAGRKTGTDAPSLAPSKNETVNLPQLLDRLLLYRRIERVVKIQREEYVYLKDPRSLNLISSIFSSDRVPIENIGLRKRQVDFLTLHFLPTVSAALLLELADLEGHLEKEQTEIKDPIACVALLVSNMVLVSQGNYDARVRSILKSCCVELLMETDSNGSETEEEKCHSRALYLLIPMKKNNQEKKEKKEETVKLSVQYPAVSKRQRALRKFEAIEKAVATDILSVMLQRNQNRSTTDHAPSKGTWKHAAWRGLQITMTGVFVGGLFAVTGGLAAPGLVAAITAFGVHGSVMFATLTTTTALASMFGVVGGGLGAYKMSKRVKGLSEWRIRRETTYADANSDDKVILTGLHATVCVSGWLASESDFQTPFGVQANDPCMPNKEIALQRFFSMHDPEKMNQVKDLVKEHNDKKKRKDKLSSYWKDLEQQYGESPDQLLPFDPPSDSPISPNVQSSIFSLLVQHCLTEEAAKRLKELWESSTMLVQMLAKNQEVLGSQTEEEEGSSPDGEYEESTVDEDTLSDRESNADDTTPPEDFINTEEDELESGILEAEDGAISQVVECPEDHTQVIWDWQATYSGECYTVTWETTFLLKLCRVATVLFLELSDQLSKQILTQSLVGATLALPSALLTASGVIDDPYQIIVLRSKKSGIELARCLLTSDEHRPISLVGFSFGARMVFDCLLELARHQKIWQERQSISNRESRGQKKAKRSADHIDYVREPASIVEDVVLIGMPRVVDLEEWIKCRELVAGRLVNCFNRKDWIVSYMINIRCGGGIRKTCGTHPVNDIQGVENYEVSDLASSHGRYLVAIPQILKQVGYSQPRIFLDAVPTQDGL